jgi:hypothetical protein
MRDESPTPEAAQPDRWLAFLRRFAADALPFWEGKRLVFNGALAAIVVLHVAYRWPESRAMIDFDSALRFFVLAVMANLAYCAAYAIDFFVALADNESFRGNARLAILGVGTAFAGALAHFYMQVLWVMPA